jgi:hypothetical protein
MNMVQIHFLKAVASAKGVWGPGEIATVDPVTAEEWCRSGICERIHGVPDAPSAPLKAAQKGSGKR